MNHDALISSVLAEFEIPLQGIVQKSSTESDGYFVYIKIDRDASGRQVPGNATLQKARNALHQAGVVIEFLLNDSIINDFESGLRATLLHRFPGYVRNAFVSVERKSAMVWIDPKPGAANIFGDIENVVKSYLKQFEFELKSAVFTIDENLPTDFYILRVVRLLSPAPLELIRDELKGHEFSVPSDDWLKRKLEVLRKRGLLVWIKPDPTNAVGRPPLYALSLTALRALGTIKSKSSPDITRLLAFARSGS
ncbi:hypothetical protein SAMN04244573_03993 [Azotobacter beijerinckii]|uniref:Uncharacterized protein n=1 Tax=Azotobacter beijerinckii TaxID=170623 RepID=A0A1H9QPI2_9GAMM|nr:hypothetical protein [Azotobacter beijerinckii]SER62354.1 hypothetical protein SAMN04244573_03993 [Azotobacter beijerinckii]